MIGRLAKIGPLRRVFPAKAGKPDPDPIALFCKTCGTQLTPALKPIRDLKAARAAKLFQDLEPREVTPRGYALFSERTLVHDFDWAERHERKARRARARTTGLLCASR